MVLCFAIAPFDVAHELHRNVSPRSVRVKSTAVRFVISACRPQEITSTAGLYENLTKLLKTAVVGSLRCWISCGATL